ncbi:flagellar biosynthesis protein [Clostridium acetobutylicum]|uniref:Flagellar biosynthesis related protein n=1 Tax=Clostridium acetobutylicum (strain ATCC 824 / DSM 792 / JCM 1419 / IAM 19013 / LMG 5710 / NBRC 13948 / NRRL B-527 / VKM B-1787 / 2291 / W) TaxID=272562 RepID=Q97LC3_CLOAB|nr:MULTISPECIES: EscU/YscU/HrcU family type III secretion system export apparatus switch protein [Clostridium]AAK78616.1 Flagellar biosynthesis related protein [Clostridium acetobutylicum ATCC 824]ADZ19690.1 Flagellar biosynthesis related protein [Clostridium acetobutylicum EA 2018]AEI34676.1 flagellar biosynthesis related protein [Clostridium acetobutylicum DSM 1731]AWV80340.1 flagellar biogenesis protein [Clostridium acetobutylicum]MBC2392527.1 EscU/YscU/HrcU family type III secretion system
MAKERKKAAALKYDLGYEAPIVTAVGVGKIADNIVKKASENEVPVVYNKELTDLLLNVDVGSSIPYEIYDVVAEVIAYIMEVDSGLQKRR